MDKTMIQAAIEVLTQEIDKDKNNAILLKERGRLRSLAGDSQGAMSDLREAIKLDPNLIKEFSDGLFSGNINSCH